MKKNRKKRIVCIEGKNFVYYVRHSRRAKNLLLRVDVSGQVELVVPWWVTFREAEKFINTQSHWLTKIMKKNEEKRRMMPSRKLVSGEQLLVFGEDYELKVTCDVLRQRSRYSEKIGQVSVVVVNKDDVKNVLTKWYRKKADEYFKEAVDGYSARLNVQVLNLVVSGAQSQWGSCMVGKQRVSLCWRLALAPREVANYVVAHEVAHMKERGHSHRFWKVVESLDPNYKEHRSWLRKHGYTLVL